MPQPVKETPLFAAPRTAARTKAFESVRSSNHATGSVRDWAPPSSMPAGQAVIAHAERSPAVKVQAPVAAVRITVHRVAAAPSAPWPANEDGRPVFWPIVEWSADGDVWEEAASFGPVYSGVEVRTAAMGPGFVRIAEAVGGTDAAFTYSAELLEA